MPDELPELTQYFSNLSYSAVIYRKDNANLTEVQANEIIRRAKAYLAQQKRIKEVCQAIKIRIAFIGHPNEPMNEAGPDWSKEVALIEVLEKENP